MSSIIFTLVSAVFDQFGNSGDRPHQAAGIQRHHHHLAVVRGADLLQRIGIFLCDEVVHGLDIPGGNRLGDHLRRAGFRFCRTFTRFRLEEGRLTVALGFQDLRLFSPSAFRISA